MKKINEATKVSSAIISGWKGAWRDANTVEEREKVFRDILAVGLDYKNIYQRLLSFGIVFVGQWLEAMKFEELGNYKNDLIYLFDMSENNIDNYYYLDSVNNFIKLYNVYASGLLKKEYFENKSTKDVFVELVNNPRMYQFNDDDFKTIFRTFDDLVGKGYTENQLKDVFLEKDDNGEFNGDVNQIPVINDNIKHMGGEGIKQNRNKERSDIESIINNVAKWSDDEVEYLYNALKDRLPA